MTFDQHDRKGNKRRSDFLETPLIIPRKVAVDDNSCLDWRSQSALNKHGNGPNPASQSHELQWT